MGTLDQPNEITDVEVLSTSIEPGGMGAIEEVDSADTDVVDESGAESDIGVVEIDITSELSSDQIRDLFAAFSDEDWSEVDRLLNDWEQNGVYTDTKAGGADRNRGGAESFLGPVPTFPISASAVLAKSAFDAPVLTGEEVAGIAAAAWPGLQCSPDVLAQSDYFKVIGVDAQSDTAQVVDSKAVRDGSDQNLVGVPVNLYRLAVDGHKAVPVAVLVAGPQPAGISLVDPRDEGIKAFSLVGQIGVVPPSPVASGTQPTGVKGLVASAGGLSGSELPSTTFALVTGATEATGLGGLVAVKGDAGHVRILHESKAGGADRNRGSAEQLRRYWTVGVGGQKIRWGMPGDWTRCVQQLTEHLGPRAKGYCALRHKEMNGYYPGDKRNKSDAAGDFLTFADEPSASVVFGSGDGFKMVGTDTPSDSAEMVDMKSVRNGAVGDSVRKDVGGDDLSSKALDLPVTSTQATSEQPTTVSSKREGVESSFGTSTNSADTIVTSSSGSTKAGSMSNTQPNVMHGSVAFSNTANSHTKTVADNGAEIEFKTVGVKGMNVVSADEGIVETIISVTGLVDNVKDRIVPGAYSKTLAKRKPKGVWSHDWDTPVSKTLDVKELLPGDPELPDHMPDGDPWPSNAGALKVKTQFNLETQRGREAYSDVVFFGEEQEWSIGYNVPVGGAKVDQKSGVREIETLELYEYSPVLFGAMPLARTTSVKEAQLALKALKGGAAAWLAEAPAETVDNTDEYEAAGSDDIEDQLVDDFEGKDMSLTGDQMILVKRAITTLTDLLDVVQGDVEVKSDMAEASDDEDEDDSDEGDDVQEYDTLVEAIDDIVNDSEIYDALIDPASAIDDALNVDDVEALDQASNEFLDGIQAQMKRDGVDVQLLRDLASTVADLIQQVSGEEGSPEMPSEDTIEKKEPEVEAETTEDVADAEPEPVGAAEGKTILSVEEIESFIKDFNAK